MSGKLVYIHEKNHLCVLNTVTNELREIPPGFCCDDVTYAPVDQPPIDWKETPLAFVFKADVPEVKKRDMLVGVQDRYILCISGERYPKEEANTLETLCHCKERTSGFFARIFKLHEDVRIEDARAKLEDGVLTITLPKVVRTGDVRVIHISG